MSFLLSTHSLLRYAVMLLLLTVIVRAVSGWLGKKPFQKADDKVSLFLLIATHLQAVVGIILYFISDHVQFNGDTMKNGVIRYWTVEHITGMLIAVVLITAARSTSKRMTTDLAKHKRLAIFNIIALVVVLIMLTIGAGPGIVGGAAFQ